MSNFIIIGKITLWIRCYKNHCYCHGYHEIIKDISLEVEVKDKANAVHEAYHKMHLLNKGIEDAEWIGEPTVSEVPQDILMARLDRKIAPTLPGLEL